MILRTSPVSGQTYRIISAKDPVLNGLRGREVVVRGLLRSSNPAFPFWPVLAEVDGTTFDFSSGVKLAAPRNNS